MGTFTHAAHRHSAWATGEHLCHSVKAVIQVFGHVLERVGLGSQHFTALDERRSHGGAEHGHILAKVIFRLRTIALRQEFASASEWI
jgi:hypothetical protein